MSKSKKHIPIGLPDLSGNEWKYVKDCIDRNWIPSGGAYVGQFESMVGKYVGAQHAIAVVNGTAALHISLLLTGVAPGDLVIAPDLTFVATINSIRYVGAEPILIDAYKDTWQMDLDLLEDFLKSHTYIKEKNCYHKLNHRKIAAIMPVHVLGNMNDMDKLLKISATYAIPVIEDSTGALGSTYKGKYAGTFGKLGCYSFNGNKIITTGGGGMIVTDDAELAQKARLLINQSKTDKLYYEHDGIGFNYSMPNILAAIGCAQMERIDYLMDNKKKSAQNYMQTLKNVEFQKITDGVISNHWLFTVLVKDRDKTIADYLSKNIQVKPFWKPISMQKGFGNNILVSNYNNASAIFSRAVSLPMILPGTKD